MATFKAVIRKKRNDGFCPVYIRVIHGKKPGYIMTDKVVHQRFLQSNQGLTEFFCLKTQFHFQGLFTQENNFSSFVYPLI